MVDEDLSAQYDTTIEPSDGTVVAGVVCVVRFWVSPAEAKVSTGSTAVPSYASRVRVPLVTAEKVMAVLVPASAATAAFL